MTQTEPMETVEQVSVMMLRIKFVDGCDPLCVLYLCDVSYVMGGREPERTKKY